MGKTSGCSAVRVKCIISEQMKSWTVLGYFSTDLKSNINKVDIWEWCLPIRSYIIFYGSVEGIQTDISLQTKLTHTFYPIFLFFQQISSVYM